MVDVTRRTRHGGCHMDFWRRVPVMAPSLLLMVVIVLLAGVAVPTGAFYVPGAQEKSYPEGGRVNFSVNSLRSSSEMFPMDYTKMPFCQPSKLVFEAESIGEIIWGDRVVNSLYTVNMKKNVTCMHLPECDAANATKWIRESKVHNIEKMINQWYRVYMSIDNLPVFSTTPQDTLMEKCVIKLGKSKTFYKQRGYPLGLPKKCTDTEEVLLNNHLDFTIHYNNDSTTTSETKEEDRKFIVVGIDVNARSIQWNDASECNELKDKVPSEVEKSRPLSMKKIKEDGVAYWTYSVKWVPSQVKWATRWDVYLSSSTAAAPGGHIFFIVLSLMVVMFMGAVVMGSLLRALHKDFNRYNSPDSEDLKEEVGWKLVHADVFRPPFHANWLAIFVANGCQVLTTSGVVLLVALMGYLSPSRRGSLATALLLTTVFTSLVGGYVCGLLLQYLNCRAWKHIFVSSLTLPGALLLMYLFVLAINKAHGSTTAIPFDTLAEVLVLFSVVSLPLTVLGGSFAFRQEPITNPTRVGRLAREIPAQNLINQPLFMYLFWPAVPLLVAIIELYYIMQDLWEGQIYYSFGFLTVTASIWVLVCGLVTVSSLYYVLCYENHQWWWVAYFVPGGGGVHMLCMSVIFFAWQLSVSSFASAVLFFAYMSMVSYMYGMAAGAVGVISSIVFVRVIYGSIKVD